MESCNGTHGLSLLTAVDVESSGRTSLLTAEDVGIKQMEPDDLSVDESGDVESKQTERTIFVERQRS